jgi:hypothetical protein
MPFYINAKNKWDWMVVLSEFFCETETCLELSHEKPLGVCLFCRNNQEIIPSSHSRVVSIIWQYEFRNSEIKDFTNSIIVWGNSASNSTQSSIIMQYRKHASIDGSDGPDRVWTPIVSHQ